MSDRFYADDDFTTGSVELAGPEAHHVMHVSRKRTGDVITIFNGRGLEASGEIVADNRRTTTLKLIDVRELPPPRGPHVTLAVAVPRHDRFRWLAEKAMELGVAALIPLQTQRSVVEPGSGKLDRIRRAVIEAAKQCGAPRLMRVAELTSWADFAEGAFAADQRACIAHPGGSSPADALGRLTPADALCFLIGPEGGFTDDEVEQAAAAGAIPVSLGPHVLRIETAAIALAAWARLSS